MKKRVAGCLVLVLGVAAMSLSVVLYQQFRKLAAEGAPKAGQYPWLERVVPELNESPNPGSASDASEVARAVSRRIYGIGTLGGVLVVGGVWLMASGPRKDA